MIVTQEITLDINGNPNRTFLCKQADDNSRFLKITLMDGTTPLTVPTGTTVTLRCLKPDGTQVYNAGTRNSDGTVTVELTAQVLAVEGLVRADVSTAYSGQILSSANFCIKVEPVPMGSGITSTSEFLQLTELIERLTDLDVVEIQDEIEDARVGYDDTTYNTLGDAVRGQAFRGTDTTLSVSGQPADAKAVGDALTEIEDARVGYDDTTYQTLGDAVRGQIEDLQEEIETMEGNVTAYVEGTTLYLVTNVQNGNEVSY